MAMCNGYQRGYMITARHACQFLLPHRQQWHRALDEMSCLAPWSKSHITALSWPILTAKCRAVPYRLGGRLGKCSRRSYPLIRSLAVISRGSGSISPTRPRQLTSAPDFTARSMVLILPVAAPHSKAIDPLGLVASTRYSNGLNSQCVRRQTTAREASAGTVLG